MSTIIVRTSNDRELEKFADDLEKVLARIDGKKFTVVVEPEFQSQVPRFMDMGAAMSFVSDIIRAHHQRVFGKDHNDGGVGPNEREVVRQWVGEQTGILRPKKSRKFPSQRQMAINAMGQAKRVLPGNRVLSVAEAGLRGQRYFRL